MKEDGQKIINIIELVIALLISGLLVFILNIYSREDNIDYVPQTNSVEQQLGTSTNNSTLINEGDDVYGQRQLRADYNNGSSGDGY